MSNTRRKPYRPRIAHGYYKVAHRLLYIFHPLYQRSAAARPTVRELSRLNEALAALGEASGLTLKGPRHRGAHED